MSNALTVELSDAALAGLIADARAQGRDAADVAAEFLNQRYAVAAASAPQNKPGKPLTQFIEEQRAKHGFPADWGTKPVILTAEDWAAIDAAHVELYPETTGEKP